MSLASFRCVAQSMARCLLAMGAIGIPYATSLAQTVIHSTAYTGVWFDAQKACVFEPFNAKYKSDGLSVVADPGLSSTTLVRLRSEKSKPTLDVAWLDGGISEQALKDDVLDGIEPQQVTNIDNMVPQGIYKAGSGGIYALSNRLLRAGNVLQPLRQG